LSSADVDTCKALADQIVRWTTFVKMSRRDYKNVGELLRLSIYAARARVRKKVYPSRLQRSRNPVEHKSARSANGNPIPIFESPNDPDVEAYFRHLLEAIPDQAFTKARFAEQPHDDILRFLSHLWVDVLSNAVYHSDFHPGVAIVWCERTKTVTFTNPLRSHTELQSVIPDLNAAMLFDTPPTRAWYRTKSMHGLRNILGFAKRVRVGLHYQLRQNPSSLSVSTYIGHLVQD
jgi:hypothetical protein